MYWNDEMECNIITGINMNHANVHIPFLIRII